VVDFGFAPQPGGNIPGTVFQAWRSDEGEASKFRVGIRTYYRKQDRWGLAFYGADADPSYNAAQYATLGSWAQLVDVTIAGEGRGRFTTLNTWDRAAFTFGFLQFAAHVADGDFVRWFRRVLARPEAADYFPTLRLVGGHIAVAGPGGTRPLEGPNSSAALMAFLNPNGDRVDADEILNAARLIDWTRRHPDTQALQVEIGVEAFRAILMSAARRVPLDGESDAVCAVVADIRHQGRGGSGVWDAIEQALAAPDKLDALLRIGADQYAERCRAIGAALRGKLAAGTLGTADYRTDIDDFVPRAGGAPALEAGPAAAPAPALTASDGVWVAFDSAPFPSSTPPGNKVLVSIPADFRPAQPFVVTLFLHGHAVDPPCTQLEQIQKIPPQVRATTTNTVLLAPRFGPTSQPGKFNQPGALSAFIAEASNKVAQLLAASGKTAEEVERARTYLTAKAPIMIASFSGGCHSLRYLLDNEAELTPRLGGVLLLDSLYNEEPQQAVIAWLKRAANRSWLVSLHSTTTERNEHVMASLAAAGIAFSQSGDWSETVDALKPGTIAFSPARGHCEIPTVGPPSGPVTAALDRLDPAYAKLVPPPDA